MTTRRFFVFGASSLLAAPAIVRAGSLMKIAPVRMEVPERVIYRSEFIKAFNSNVAELLRGRMGVNLRPGTITWTDCAYDGNLYGGWKVIDR
jgi:hypothetical protein